MKPFDCPVCHEEHEVDSTGWMQCNRLGYIEATLDNFIYELDKWVKDKLAKI